uniref:Protein translocase subunit SecY n=1 Tax=Ophidocladus simpliciusculus TaxID=1261574 RepID=A0A1Z1MJ09_9FLOR|nr:SecY-type transporter protein [Ophidocladus simpliciusculus]ARW66048.1 SecY-type transporter protein [Ophidocladus simpliciusculus]
MEKLNQITRKILITIIILFISRMGIFIPISGINHQGFNEGLEQNKLINFLNTFSGGGFSTVGIFSLGIIPYINSSIITQLLVKIIPQLEDIQKNEGEIGKRKINQITRYFTVAWALIQSLSISLWIKPYTFSWDSYFIIDLVITLTTGSTIIMWFSELITEYGIGNGASLLIFQNIISNIPKNLQNYNLKNTDTLKILILLFMISISILMLNILIQDSKRKINIISAKQLGEINNININAQNYIPLKINQGGVMPIVFASAAMSLTQYIISSINNSSNLLNRIIYSILSNTISYLVIYAFFIVIFSYFYSSIILNPKEIAENLQKMGASIPNIRPGIETIQHLKQIINKLTFVGSIFLFIIAQLPFLISSITKINIFQGLGTTSLLILVGVAIDTAKQIQTYIISEQYDNMME